MRLCCFSAWWHIRQRQGGDADGAWPIPAGPESAQPPATIPQACLLADRGVHFLSLFTRGRGAELRPAQAACHASLCDRPCVQWERGRKAPDRSRIRCLAPGGNRPRPSHSRSQQYRSRVVLESTLRPLASRDTAIGPLMEGIPTLGIGRSGG